MNIVKKEDLQTLFLATKNAYKGYSFEKWEKEVKISYKEYCKSKSKPMSFSQWINGQILALSYLQM